jgi:putative hydrolase of the HAD superfamily
MSERQAPTADAAGIMCRMAEASGLLLDIGGVVLRGAPAVLPLLVEDEPALRETVERLAMTTERDELWQRMLRGEITERAYWAQRAAELGRALGREWNTRAMINRMYDRPSDDWLNRDVIALMLDTKAAALPLGALTNDLADFHGQEWVDKQDWLGLFDTIIDASHTGVLKPDPRAFAAGAEALDLPPEQIVYLDDMPWNVDAARAAGLQAVAVSYADSTPAVDEARARLGLIT